MTPAVASTRYFDWLWIFAWGLASTLWCVTAASELSATFDEPFYISQGLEFWRTGSHRGLLKKGTMPLPVDLDTLPLYLQELWRGTSFDPSLDLDRMLPVARAGTLIFWWILLVYGWKAGQSLAGPWGGRFAVAWLASEPNFLAHASLATTDIPVTACLLALIYHFRTEHAAGWTRRVGLPAFWFSAALLAKASALVLGPICLLVVTLERLMNTGAGWWRGGLSSLLHYLKPFLLDLKQILVLGLLAAFLYCGSDWRTEPSFVAWAHSLPDGPLSQGMTWLAEHLRIFSNAGEGLVKQITHNMRGHGVYLIGQTDRRALWYYFPVLITIKLTLPLLLAPLALLIFRPRSLGNWAILTALALLLLTPTFRVQIGIRMILPLVALGVVGLSASVVQTWKELVPGFRRQMVALAATASVLGTLLASVAAWPHGLSYINEFWGGASRGYMLVSDSNYDWGQGLYELQWWQQQQGSPPLAVWYFGTDPVLNRLSMHQVPSHQFRDDAGGQDIVALVRGRYLAVSTTLLFGSYMESHRRAVAFLREQQPVARTTTFMIYDFREPYLLR